MPMKQPTISTRRRFPRIEVDLPVAVTTASGQTFDLVTKNISQTGLLIVADRDQFEQLTASQRRCEKSRPAEAAIRMSLPIEGAPPIHTGCRLFQFRRFSRDCYHIGLEYMALSEPEQDALSRYIQEVVARGRSRQPCQAGGTPLAARDKGCRTA